MVLFYIGQSTPTFPLTDHTPIKHRRNEQIQSRYAKGETIGYLARLFDISVQWVSQIVLKRRKVCVQGVNQGWP
jgi:Mor family transcriptional regulator